MTSEVNQVAQATGGIATLGINGKIFIAQLINFLIVLFVLKKWAFGPIVKILEARSERVEKSVKDAEAIEQRLLTLDAERAEILRTTKGEAEKLLAGAAIDAETRKVDMVEKAKREVERVIMQGKGHLKAEKEAMLIEVRKEIVDIAVSAVKKILQETVDEKKSKSLAEEVVRKMT